MDGKPHIRRTAVAPFLSLSLSLFLSPFLTATSIADTTIAGQTTTAIRSK